MPTSSTSVLVMNMDDDGSSLFALLELIGDDADKAINLVTEAADSNDVLDLVIEGVWDESE